MFPIATGLNFDSNINTYGNSIARQRIILRNHIKIPKHDGVKHFIKLIRAKIPNTANNFTSELKNNTIRYSVNDGVAYKVITLPNGIYNFYDVDSYIKHIIELNGDVEIDPVTSLKIYPFVIQISTSSRKGYLLLDSTHSKDPDIIVDLTNNGTSEFYLRYGFLLAEAILDADVAHQQISTNDVDIYDSQIKIRCNIVKSYLSGDDIDDVLFLGNVSGSSGGIFELSSHDDIIGILRESEQISNIVITLVDRNDQLILFDDNSTDSNITLSFNIY